jgi:hypothetical protein
MVGITAAAAATYSKTDMCEQLSSMAPAVKAADDNELQDMLHSLDVRVLQQIVTRQPNITAEDYVLTTGRHIGRYAATSITAAGPLVTFRPGGVNLESSSSSGEAITIDNSSGALGNVIWYNQEMVATLLPWLVLVARSMWLMGQVLSELQLGASSSSSNNSALLHLRHWSASDSVRATMVDNGYFIELLETVFACVEWLGSQLCHMQLPGDDAATTGSDSSPEDTAASMPLLTQLLQQHAQLQTGLYAAVQSCVAAGQLDKTQHDVKSADAASLVQRVWGDQLPGQLRAFGAAVAAALPVGWACNNAACTNLGNVSELQLVYGPRKICSRCMHVRLCSAECQKQHWDAGHSFMCKKLPKPTKLTAAAAAAKS